MCLGIEVDIKYVKRVQLQSSNRKNKNPSLPT